MNWSFAATNKSQRRFSFSYVESLGNYWKTSISISSLWHICSTLKQLRKDNVNDVSCSLSNHNRQTRWRFRLTMVVFLFLCRYVCWSMKTNHLDACLQRRTRYDRRLRLFCIINEPLTYVRAHKLSTTITLIAFGSCKNLASTRKIKILASFFSSSLSVLYAVAR